MSQQQIPAKQQSSDSGNTENKSEDQWRAIVESSKALLKAAQDGQWENMTEQAKYRDELIRDYFSTPIKVDQALKAHQDISKILAIDEQLLGLARKQRDKFGAALKQINTGAAASKAYQQFS